MNVSMILMKVSGPQYPLARTEMNVSMILIKVSGPQYPLATDRNERQYDPNESQRPTIPASHGPK